MEWLGKSHALIAKWNPIEAIAFAGASNHLATNALRIASVAEILGMLHRAIAAVELTVPKQAAQAFGPGAVYDFLKSLRELLASATTAVLVVDSYLDEQIFDASTKYGLVEPDQAIERYNVPVSRALADPAFLRQLCEQGRQRALEKYDQLVLLDWEKFQPLVGAAAGKSSVKCVLRKVLY